MTPQQGQLDDLEFIDTVKKMPLMALPVRTVLVPVEEGKILISPGSMCTPEQLKGRGVTDIVAPNLFHSAGIPNAIAAYGNAKVWGAPGIGAHKPDIKWTAELTLENWPYQSELPAVFIEGMPAINEVVFVHRKTRTLIATDLCFNMTDARGIGPWIILNLFGTYRRFGVSKFLLKFTKDRLAAERSLKSLFEFDFDNIVMSHGQIVLGSGKALLRKAFIDRGFSL